MVTLQVPLETLKQAGFKKYGANHYYPADDNGNHIHLGTPTMQDKNIAEPGNCFVTFISLKINDSFYARLTKSELTGKFDPFIGKPWPDDWQQVLASMGLLQQLGTTRRLPTPPSRSSSSAPTSLP